MDRNYVSREWAGPCAAIAIVEQWSDFRGLEVIGLVLFVQDRLPGCVGVEALHLFELPECIWAEVLLVDDAIVADHERLYTGDAVLGWRSDESKAAYHGAFDDVVELSERGGGALSFEDFEVVTVIGRFSGIVTLCDGASNLFADWTLPLTVGGLPSEAVLLTGRTDDALSVLVHVIEFA